MFLRERVAVIGAGMTKFGEHYDKGWDDLAAEAYLEALNSVDKGIDPKDIEAIWLGTGFAIYENSEISISSRLAVALGMELKPITRVENACPTGAEAIRNACLAVASGMYDVVLAIGVEKLREFPSMDHIFSLEWDAHPILQRALTPPGIFALWATRHMHEFGTRREHFAKVAIKNHRNGSLNPKAHFQREITMEDYFRAPIVAWPFGLYDCCPLTDAGAAAIICKAELARKYTDNPIYWIGSGLAVDSFYIAEVKPLVTFRAAVEASRQAYKVAGIGPEDIDLAEIHDCFTATELILYEDLGFCRKGEGAKLVEEGQTELGGRIPVNPSGGLKAKGHPIGATGIGQVGEIFLQLRNEARKRQVDGAEIALQQNIGGPATICAVNIFRRS